jgi:hypothetical protein
MKKNVPLTDPNGDAKKQLLEKAEQLMTVKIEYLNISNFEFLDY